ncbi:ABC-type polysaccharide/polyol phosphate transport system, ATPase component [Desulfosporosinus acidiphilus SJ4]|uniref:ABC-type polysaccharide/polyol phosphate transport system, ATPase component n=1 Tax=Desulfosporosinus acidiphilus (strain DSM 22704 / JCM 16185 / SJ4) TaxID=646529 RepID=I4DBT7_DESAJ|nr:ABC transporter ATP-binding protein [Desulfosporosinus acidiphilus]AFM43261.1 ABC-type polysaccharide/polyol phosphate transport system, ATPase component [Desulfosporosinus acidiphilus SJ4]
MEYVIEAQDIWKRFRLFHDRAPTLKERVLFSHRRKYDDLWVLKGVDLKVERGKTIGLIGQNGSGKSTLLKLMTRILYPDRGGIQIRGKVSSLLELGAGFHPDFSGIENIYMNAAIFGLTKKDIDRKLDEIISFSELEEFIDSPVRTYSSGMYMRLAFSIAINVEPDVLLVDEILAVGDESFQKKCLNKMKSFKSLGVTTVIVSHSMSQLEMLCDELVWLHEGKIVRKGIASEVIDDYRVTMFGKENLRLEAENRQKAERSPEMIIGDGVVSENNPEFENESTFPQSIDEKRRWGNGAVNINEVVMLDNSGQSRFTFESGQPCTIQMLCKINKSISNLVFGIAIYRNDDIWCYGSNTFIDRYPVDVEKLGDEVVVRANIEKLNLVEGEYYLNVASSDGLGTQYDYWARSVIFNMYSHIKDVGVCRLDHQWEVFQALKGEHVI